MMQERKQFLEFGPFRIELGERLLRRGTEVIALTPKAVDTLLVLACNDGRVVEKDELIRRVWPDTFIEEGGLARNISQLRRALGASDDTYIETIARRGYRFAAPVKQVEEEAVEANSIAVLPLANLSGDPAQNYFADGMTDELISYLMRIERLRVCSRTSVMAYKSAAKSLREIARELNVRWVVEGTVLQADGRVRISARLIDGATEKHLWNATYERSLRDVLGLQSEVASDIAREIRVKLTLPEKAKLERSRPVNPEAYEDYLRGRYFWNLRTIEGLCRAREYFEQAIRKDPSYAPAHCGLADTYGVLSSTGYDVLPPHDAMPRAKVAALDALRIDDGLAEAHAALGYVHLVYEWDWDAAERELSRAIELNSAYPTAHQWRGELLLAKNNPDEASASFRRALAADPLSIPANLGLGWSFYFTRQYDLALQQHRKTLELAPNAPMALYGVLLAYHHKRMGAEAGSELRHALRCLGDTPAVLMLMGVTHAITGMRDAAHQDLQQLQALADEKYVPAVYFAFINMALSDLDATFFWLQKALEERCSYLIFLNVQPAMQGIREDARFPALLARIGPKAT